MHAITSFLLFLTVFLPILENPSIYILSMLELMPFETILFHVTVIVFIVSDNLLRMYLAGMVWAQLIIWFDFLLKKGAHPGLGAFFGMASIVLLPFVCIDQRTTKGASPLLITYQTATSGPTIKKTAWTAPSTAIVVIPNSGD